MCICIVYVVGCDGKKQRENMYEKYRIVFFGDRCKMEQSVISAQVLTREKNMPHILPVQIYGL